MHPHRYICYYSNSVSPFSPYPARIYLIGNGRVLSALAGLVNSSPCTAWGRELPKLTERAGQTLTRSFDAVYTDCQGYTGHLPAQTSLDKYEIQ